MADFIVSDGSLRSVADAIRERGGTSSPIIFPDGFASAIRGIPHDAIIGSFTGTTSGIPIDIELDYTGDSFPTAILIYPSEGAYDTSGVFTNMIKRYGIVYWAGMKSVLTTPPRYEGIGPYDFMSCFLRYKNSATDGRVTSTTYWLQTYTYKDIDASESSTLSVRLKSKSLMSVFIAGNSYGFVPNIPYNYAVLY